jgi:pimeloyl-ACP methyl ester carboxylesterase
MDARVDVEGIGPVDISYSERGSGRPVVVLHGGAGPISVVPWAELLARTHPVRVITPTHPGFMGTPRPDRLATVAGLARVYAAFLRALDLHDVTVVGNSVGGWIATELALAAPDRVGRLVIVDGSGVEVPGHPVADPFALPFDELSRRSYHDPDRFRIDPSKFTPQQKAGFAANMATLKVYAATMTDGSLRSRLSTLHVPTLLVWGESDRVIDPEYGRAFAAAIPGATFHVVPSAGHLPQIETPEELTRVVGAFLGPA